jgi:hypothetical protein
LHLWRLGPRSQRAELLVLPTFGALWLVWFVAVSAGYDRYAIPILAIGSMFLAVVWHDVVRAAAATDPEHAWSNPLAVGAGLALAAPVISSLGLQLAIVARPPAPDAQTIAAAITRQVEPSAVIETIDWQLDILADREFHHPPPFVPLVPYSVPTTTDYLVDGPWSKMYHLYGDELASGRYTRMVAVGDYELYRRSPGSG